MSIGCLLCDRIANSRGLCRACLDKHYRAKKAIGERDKVAWERQQVAKGLILTDTRKGGPTQAAKQSMWLQFKGRG